ncbi:hypothetical protein [Campylobacter sp.]|nr:hypothetical protein [Campylobacter sp.]
MGIFITLFLYSKLLLLYIDKFISSPELVLNLKSKLFSDEFAYE